MKEYMKPELEYVKFETEDIASDLGNDNGESASNNFVEDDFS